jgi:cytochrome c553
MYESSSVFDHDLHAQRLGGSDGCTQCHSEGSEVKSYETVTECSECHENEIAHRAFIEAPPDRWGEAVGYMDAMHSLCVECHEREALTAPAQNPDGLNQCRTCHDVDWRREVEKLMPQLNRADRMAVSPLPAYPGAQGAGG